MTETSTQTVPTYEDVVLYHEDIIKLIPHREPMLMVDEVKDIVHLKSATGVKYVKAEEDHFRGHFPGHPIMPGVLIIEAMAQSAAVMVVHSLGDIAKDKLVYFMSVDEARFRSPVFPGDELIMKCETVQSRGTVWKFSGKAYVGDKLCAQAVFKAMIMDRDEKA